MQAMLDEFKFAFIFLFPLHFLDKKLSYPSRVAHLCRTENELQFSHPLDREIAFRSAARFAVFSIIIIAEPHPVAPLLRRGRPPYCNIFESFGLLILVKLSFHCSFIHLWTSFCLWKENFR